MMHSAWSSIVEVPYCFSRSYMKCCTKLETAKERCPIVFQGHPSSFKVTRYKTSPILTQIGRFRTIGRSQLSNLSDLPCVFNFPFSRWQLLYDSCTDWFIYSLFNSSPHSATYMCQWIKSALVQIMACRLFGAKPLSIQMLRFCQLDRVPTRSGIREKVGNSVYSFKAGKW